MNRLQDDQGYINSNSNSNSNSANSSAYWPSLSPISSASQTNIYTGQTQSPFIPPPETSLHQCSSNPTMPVAGTATGPIDAAVPANTKVAIPRLNASQTVRGRRRSARACEPCRQRKIKCDGNRPTCGQCVYHNNHCSYEDVKRVRDQKMLELLSQRVERYESLLRGLEGEVNEPTARRIRKALKFKDGKANKPPAAQEDHPEDSDSSMGSMEAMDLVDEDLNRNENTRAAGFYGKSSEVSWMQKLEDATEQKERCLSSGSRSPRRSIDESYQGTGAIRRHEKSDVPISWMNYHLDDVKIKLVKGVDPFDIPPKEVADEYFEAYMTYVHPFYGAIRKSAFAKQILLLYSRRQKPSKKWLAILNMIFAIGCRYYKLVHPSNEGEHRDDLVFLTRARVLGLPENILFDHTDLQQIQLEFLVAVYMLCLGQVNRASKFSSMALRSALSLGINLRLTDSKIDNTSKEARCRLWWSIYSLEHLLTSMHGRASCIGEGLCAVPPPLPIEEESFAQPEAQELLKNQPQRESQLRPTLFETQSQLQQTPSYTSLCTPCPSLFFYHLVDLALISQAVLNKVYSIEGVREGVTQTEWRLQIYRLRMDRWLSNLPKDYQFTIPESGPWHINHARLEDESLPYTRERVCLALAYYSARITLCRPCLSQPHSHSSSPTHSLTEESLSRVQLRAEMATQCLQAACSLISILPDQADVTWLARLTPWWGVLHSMMQATTALLLALSYCSHALPETTEDGMIGANANANANATSTGPFSNNDTNTINDDNIDNHHRQQQQQQRQQQFPFSHLHKADLNTAIAQTLKALRWIHTMAMVDRSARRAFKLCDGMMRKIAPGLGVELQAWPAGDFADDLNQDDGGGSGRDGRGEVFGGDGSGDEVSVRMEGLDDLVDFGGGDDHDHDGDGDGDGDGDYLM